MVGADGTVIADAGDGRAATTPTRCSSPSGLHKGDLVVIAGVNSLAEGQKVTVEKVAAP